MGAHLVSPLLPGNSHEAKTDCDLPDPGGHCNDRGRALITRFTALLALLIASYFGILAALHGSWKLLGVQAGPQPFGDLRNIGRAADCIRAQPQTNPYDGSCAGPLYNYPKAWLVLRENQTPMLGCLFGAAYLLSAIWVLRPANYKQAIYAALLICSPCLMLVVERGNTDEWMFVILTLALAVPLLRYPLIVAAAVLKLFPFAALAIVVRENPNKRLPLILGTTTIFAAYLFYTISDLKAIRDNTPAPAVTAYGVSVPARAITSLFDPAFRAATLSSPQLSGLSRRALTTEFDLLPPLPPDGLQSVRQALQLAAILFAATLVILAIRSRPASLTCGPAFLAGTAIYLTTFLAATNFDYRLIFLLFTVPQLWEWAPKRREATLALMAIAGAVWFGRFPFYLTFGIDWACEFALFFLLVRLFAASRTPAA